MGSLFKTKKDMLNEQINYYQNKQKEDNNYYLMSSKDTIKMLKEAKKIDINIINLYKRWDDFLPMPLLLGNIMEDILDSEEYYLGFYKMVWDKEFKWGNNLNFEASKISFISSMLHGVALLKSQEKEMMGGLVLAIPQNERKNNIIELENENIIGYYWYSDRKINFTVRENELSKKLKQ